MEGSSVTNPEVCAQLLTVSLDELADDVADHHTMSKQDAYFRVDAYLTRLQAPTRKYASCFDMV